MKLLDTSFLIDLQRERAAGLPGVAHAYLLRPDGGEFCISTITALEFLEGYRNPVDGERFLEPFPQLDVTPDVSRAGSRIRRALRTLGQPIGDFDVLIAATALASGLPLVTDNLRHFQRVEGLTVESYR